MRTPFRYCKRWKVSKGSFQAANVRWRIFNCIFSIRFWVKGAPPRPLLWPNYGRHVFSATGSALAATQQSHSCLFPLLVSVAGVNEKQLRRRPNAGTGDFEKLLMRNPTPYLKMRVLAAIDMAPGRSIQSRIQAVSQMTFIDEDGHPCQFTWRTIQTWFSRYQKHGVTVMENQPRSDKCKVRKVAIEDMLEAIRKVRPKVHGKTPSLTHYPKLKLYICLINAMSISMLSPDHEQDSTAPDPMRFVTTHWSMVLSAAELNSEQAQEALAELCRIYWHPLYAFIQAQGYSAHDAEDLVQDFFGRLLEKKCLAAADQSRGRFRSFLLASLKHFLANEWDKARRQKRGGGKITISIDLKVGESSCGFEPADNLTAEKVFERRWAMTLLDQVLARLAGEYAKTGRTDLFDCLRGALTKEKDSSLTYSEIAAQRGMTEAAFKMALQRMRSRYRELFRQEIGKTVAGPEEIEEEIRHLFTTFSR